MSTLSGVFLGGGKGGLPENGFAPLNYASNVTVYAKTVPIGTTIEIHFMA